MHDEGLAKLAQASPYLITVIGFFLTILTGSIWMFYFFALMVLCSMLNTGLKAILLHTVGDHPSFVRPGSYGSPTSSSFAYGMPSGHAQFLTFVVMFVSLYLYTYPSTFGFSTSVSTLCVTLLILFTVYVCYKRVETGCHTPLQIIAGAVIGATFGFVAFRLGQAWFS